MAMIVLPASAPVVLTHTGAMRLVMLLSPTAPLPLLPQAASAPSEHKAMLCADPAAIATTCRPASTPLRSTSTAALLSVVLLLPNWPPPLLPQATMAPSEHKAKLCDPPQVMAMTVLPASAPVASTNTGTAELYPGALLVPNWLSPLDPQVAMLPSEHNTKL